MEVVPAEQSQVDRAYEQLSEEIIRGELVGGVHLSEVALAERLGVSRTPLRQAIQRLTLEGLVKTTPGRGAFVSELTLSEIANLLQMREALETYIARLHARAGDRSEFEGLRADFEAQQTILRTARRIEDHIDDCYALVARMDAALYDGIVNPYLDEAARAMRRNLRRIRQIARRTPVRMAATIAEHLAICQAIHAGDEDQAAKATAAHINNSFHNILGVIAADAGIPGTPR